MTFQTVQYSREDGVAEVVLDRPDKLNAYNTQMRDELYQVLEAVRDDPEVRVMLLRGAGERAFCAGADLTEFGTAPSQAIARRVRFERDVWGLWASLSKPLVCALHGFVMGSGGEMALLCDFRIAAEDAVFALPEVALGMIPAAGGTQTLPRVVGIGHALDLLLTARRIDAAEALEWGLVSQVVPRSQLLEEARTLARHLASLEPRALAALKQAVQQGVELPLAEGLALERRLAAGLAPSSFREGSGQALPRKGTHTFHTGN